jgi:hypothetical protein
VARITSSYTTKPSVALDHDVPERLLRVARILAFHGLGDRRVTG